MQLPDHLRRDSVKPRPSSPKSEPRRPAESDPRAVMVVFGRNELARRAMFDFLRALGLKPLEWSELVAGTGKGSPYVGEVLEHAFERARAVVVLLTPDDEARLRQPFRGPGDPDHETHLTPQARPNVLFEAGMALGVHPDRTVLIELGRVRPFSDIAGRHLVHLGATETALRDIAKRLKEAGCTVDTSGEDWLWTGRFRPALELTGVTPEPSELSSAAVAKENDAIHDLLDELGTMRLRIERAVRDERYPSDFDLPALEYHQHKAYLSPRVRESVSRIYVKADDLVTDLRRRDGSDVQDGDGLNELLEIIDAVQIMLRGRVAESA